MYRLSFSIFAAMLVSAFSIRDYLLIGLQNLALISASDGTSSAGISVVDNISKNINGSISLQELFLEKQQKEQQLKDLKRQEHQQQKQQLQQQQKELQNNLKQQKKQEQEQQKNQKQQQQQQEGVVSTSSECSCLNDEASEECCERVFRRTHKMGYKMTKHELFADEDRFLLTQAMRSTLSSQSVDFRDVILIRNWYETFVSGYLYHKTGHECMKNPEGDKLTHMFLGTNSFAKNWDHFLHWIDKKELQPPKNKRSICRYLREESEVDGMRAYIDAAFGHWYFKLIDNIQLATGTSELRASTGIVTRIPRNKNNNNHKQNNKEAERISNTEQITKEDRNRTLFLCYEDLVDPEKREGQLKQIFTHLFPGGTVHMRKNRGRQMYQHQRQRRKNGNEDKQKPNGRLLRNHESSYNHGHATDHNATLRQGLTDVIKELDRKVFNGTIALLQQQKFSCG